VAHASLSDTVVDEHTGHLDLAADGARDVDDVADLLE
jgi:hypothetical protein